MADPTNRLPNLDKLRGFAALSVILYHVIELSQWKSYPVSGPMLWGRIGWMGVDLFFVISGLVISYSAWTLSATYGKAWGGHYWRRRLTRIVPLYLCTGLIFMVFVEPSWLSLPFAELVWHLLTHGLFIHNWFPGTHGSINGANWSIGVEMQFYLLVFLGLPWIIRAKPWILILSLFLVAWAWRALVFLIFEKQGAGVLFHYSTQLPGMLDEFALGMLIAKMLLDESCRHIGVWIRRQWLPTSVAAALIVVVMLSLFWPNAEYWNSLVMVAMFRSMIGLAACAAILCAITWPFRVPRFLSYPLDFFGRISYGLYLWHLLVILSLNRLGVPPGVPYLIKAVVVTAILATASFHLFEKPWMQRARSMLA